MNFVILMGPPGSGKGTQASLLQQRKDYILLSTGDLLRDEMKNKSDFGSKVSDFINRGLLVPDALITGFIIDYIEKNRLYEKKVVFDGFPRRISQAEALNDLMKKYDKNIDSAILIDLSDEEIIRRLTGRKMCPKCKTVYSAEVKEDKCMKCGSELIIRTDDNAETISKRIDVYKSETSPLIDYFNEKNVMKKINGQGNIENIYEQIIGVIENNG